MKIVGAVEDPTNMLQESHQYYIQEVPKVHKLRGPAFVLAQIGTAGAALGAWLLLSALLPAGKQQIPVESYAYGAPLGLILTLGLAYILPNTFRLAPENRRKGRGEWSGLVAIAIAIDVLAMAMADVAVLASSGREWVLTFAASLAIGGLMSLGVLIAQLGRVSDDLLMTTLGLATTPLAGIAWLAAVPVAGDWPRTALAVALMTVTAAVLVCWAIPYASLARPYRARLAGGIRASIALVPHLAAFGFLVQGIRLPAAIRGSDADLAASHRIMLVVSVGLTLLASVNGHLAPRLQSFPDVAYRGNLGGMMTAYGLAGAGCWLLVLASLVLGVTFDLLPGLTLLNAAILSLVVLFLASYYSMSAQLIRGALTIRVAAASVSAAAVLFGPSLLGMDFSMGAMVVNYVIAAAVLACLAGAFLRAARGRHEVDLSGFSAAAFGVTLAVGLVALEALT